MFTAAPIIPNDYIAITESDTADLPETTIGIFIPSAGTLVATLRSGTAVTFTTTVENTLIPGAFKRVLEASTATGMLAAVR